MATKIASVPTKVAGVTFDDPATGMNRQEIIRSYVRPGAPLQLRLEDGIPGHPEAVAVWFQHERVQYHIGYLYHVQAVRVRPELERGKKIPARVKNVTGAKDSSTLGVNLTYDLPVSKQQLRQLDVEGQEYGVKKNNKRARGCLFIVGALIVVAVLGSILSNPGGSQNNTAPVERAVAFPTFTNTPLAVEPPTEAPAVEPPTEVPTNTPETAVDSEESAEIVYRLSVAAAGEDYSDAMSRVADVMLEAGDNPGVIFTDDWVLRAGFAIAAMQMAGDDIRELQPPLRFERIHEQLLIAVGHYDQAANLYAQGVDNLDVDSLNAGIEEMSLGQEAMQQVTALAQELLDTRLPTDTSAPAVIAFPTATPEVVRAAPIVPILPDASLSECPCDQGDTLNCGDFESFDAQSCLLRCIQLVGLDVHALDGDSDGNACEWK